MLAFCNICGKKIDNRDGRKTCSRKCRLEKKRLVYEKLHGIKTRICLNCGEKFELHGKNNNSKYCNIKCSKKYLLFKRRLRYNLDPQYKLRRRLGNQLYKHIKDQTGKFSLVGCSLLELQKHLESQFKEGMSWENYGFYGWHIDHIRPCASFNLADLKEQKLCFHYTNLQPLWWEENLSKGDNYYE